MVQIQIAYSDNAYLDKAAIDGKVFVNFKELETEIRKACEYIEYKKTFFGKIEYVSEVIGLIITIKKDNRYEFSLTISHKQDFKNIMDEIYKARKFYIENRGQVIFPEAYNEIEKLTSLIKALQSSDVN